MWALIPSFHTVAAPFPFHSMAAGAGCRFTREHILFDAAGANFCNYRGLSRTGAVPGRAEPAHLSDAAGCMDRAATNNSLHASTFFHFVKQPPYHVSCLIERHILLID
jgi:hypothetical protein